VEVPGRAHRDLHVCASIRDREHCTNVTASAWLSVLDEAVDACLAHGRPDLARRLRGVREQPDGVLRIALVGHTGQGKSRLVNALLNAPICAVGDAAGTPVPTEVRYSAEPTALLVRRVPGSAAPHHEPIEIGSLASALSSTDPTLEGAEAGLPRELLASGLRLIDTPPVGPPRSPDTAAALDAVLGAHAAVLVSDATAALSDEELALAKYLSACCPSMVVVLSKIDACPDWQSVADRDRALLAEAGISAEVLGVSATVRQHAASTGEQELNDSSGVPRLLSWLTRECALPPAESRSRVVAFRVRAAMEEIVATVKSELDAPAGQRQQQVAAQQATQRRADRLRRHQQRWQNLLADEIANLSSDVEYDLRERTRKIVQHIDDTFDDTDPLRVWPDFSRWLETTLIDSLDTNYRWLADRADWIARTVATEFPQPSHRSVPDLGVAESQPGADDLGVLDRPRIEGFKVGQKAFTGLRGSYGGVLMFGLATSLAGLPLINPISLGAGAAFATKSVRDEADVRLKRRQAVAKAGAQRFVDDVFLRFSKECKDLVRELYRGMRDHFTELGEELADDARRERDAIQSGAAQQERRTLALRREVERLAGVHRRAGALRQRALESARRPGKVSA
jgi:hypothetical protein